MVYAFVVTLPADRSPCNNNQVFLHTTTTSRPGAHALGLHPLRPTGLSAGVGGNLSGGGADVGLCLIGHTSSQGSVAYLLSSRCMDVGCTAEVAL